MNLFAYLCIAYLIIGLLYALNLNAKPMHQKPLWTNTQDPIKRLFAIVIWMTTWPLALVNKKK